MFLGLNRFCCLVHNRVRIEKAFPASALFGVMGMANSSSFISDGYISLSLYIPV